MAMDRYGLVGGDRERSCAAYVCDDDDDDDEEEEEDEEDEEEDLMTRFWYLPAVNSFCKVEPLADRVRERDANCADWFLQS